MQPWRGCGQRHRRHCDYGRGRPRRAGIREGDWLASRDQVRVYGRRLPRWGGGAWPPDRRRRHLARRHLAEHLLHRARRLSRKLCRKHLGWRHLSRLGVVVIVVAAGGGGEVAERLGLCLGVQRGGDEALSEVVVPDGGETQRGGDEAVSETLVAL